MINTKYFSVCPSIDGDYWEKEEEERRRMTMHQKAFKKHAEDNRRVNFRYPQIFYGDSNKEDIKIVFILSLYRCATP